MEKFWLDKRFNRRVFIALLFSLIAHTKKSTANKIKINNLKCDWCWLGAVTDNSITIKAKLNHKAVKNKNYLQVFYDRGNDLSFNNLTIEKVPATSLCDRIATFNLTNLVEDTVYHYVIITDGRRYPHQGTLQFKTVKVNRPYNFAIACSSCAGGTIPQMVSSAVSNSKIFDVIRRHKYKVNGQDANLALFIHLGDLHYRNDLPALGLKENYLDDYRHNYDLVMSQTRQRNLYQNIPLAYVWDDHDYGFNDSDGTYPLKYLASQVYREQVPCYPPIESLDKTKGEGAIYQSFTIGRVRFIMTDSRFYQDPINLADRDRTILGNNQKKWLYEQFLIGKERQKTNQEKLLIWINTIPWIADKSDRQTASWNKFARERTEIANFIKENQIEQLLMISGDAHMLAIDDGMQGTANSYAPGGGGSFPVIQAASLDSTGSYKGGPYNGAKYIINSDVKSINGAIPGKGQWGLFNFIDDGNRIEVKVELKRMEQTLIEHSFFF